jgi:hypothetical protein
MTRAARTRLAIILVALLAATAYLVVAFGYRLHHGDRWGGETRQVLRPSRTVDVAVTIRNPGILPVTLTDVRVETPDLEVSLMRMLERAGDGPGCCNPGNAIAFHPVTVEPDRQLMLWMSLRVTGVNEYPPCSGFTLERVLVRFVVLKIARAEPIALRTPISFQTPC